MKDLDVIIPVYHEGDHILPVLDSFRAVQASFRVLLCYDADDDPTLTVARHQSSPGCEIALIKNRYGGVHGAVVSGFQASTAPAVLVFPADDDYNAGIIDAMLKKSTEGYDIVAASRFMPGGCMVGCRRQKAWLVRAASFTLFHLARIPTRDATNGLRLFSRRVLDEIRLESSAGFTYSIELLVKCHRLGWKIAEVPAAWFERKKGPSRFRLLRWLPAYLRWYLYAFATTYLGRGPQTVPLISRSEIRTHEEESGVNPFRETRS